MNGATTVASLKINGLPLGSANSASQVAMLSTGPNSGLAATCLTVNPGTPTPNPNPVLPLAHDPSWKSRAVQFVPNPPFLGT